MPITQQNIAVGKHILIDAWDVDPALLDDEKTLLTILSEACQKAKTTTLMSWSYAFNPQGVSVIIGLAESHAALHTYPESGYYSADVYTCGDLDPKPAIDHIMTKLGGTIHIRQLNRGIELRNDDTPKTLLTSQE
jgi:S-adenosylmethionine decarboxylase proenzyme